MTKTRTAGADARPDQRQRGPRLAAVPSTQPPAIDDLTPADANVDEAVAAAFRAGDAQAADALVRRVLPYVSVLVRRLTAWTDGKGGADADDIVQDVLVAAIAKRTTFRGEATLQTWITRIAINRCRAHARRTWLRKRLFGAWAAGGRMPTAPPPDEELTAEEQTEHVRRAVARLPAKYREPIVLCYLQNMTTTEAAQSLGLSPNTTEVRLMRAKEKLKSMIEPQ